MPGPIETAYVDIVARLDVNVSSDVDTAVRGLVRKIEGQLEALEEKGTQSARALIKDFRNVELKIGVNDALHKLDKLEDAAKEVVSAVKVLDNAKVGSFSTTAARDNLRRLEERLTAFDKAFKPLEDGKIRINVTQAREQLRLIERSVTSLSTKLADAERAGIDTGSTRAARAELDRLDDVVGELLVDLEKVNKTSITVDVNDYKLDVLKKKLEEIDRDIPISLRIDDRPIREADRAVNTADRLGTQVNAFQKAFGSAFRRILAFGAIQGAIQGISSLFRAGVQAAGAIQTVEVSLNRFFAQTRNLGQTSGEFFNNLRKLALETPFEFEGLADTSRRILAMGEDADSTIEIMGDLTNAVAAVGGGQGEIDGVVRALSQLRSKGRVDLQDFRQISENLPSLSRQLQIKGVVDELNDLHPGLNATIGDFDKLRKSGLITGQVLTSGVIRAIKEIPGVAGAARAASRTLEGALSNLADFAKQEFSQAFGGLGGLLADQLNDAFGNLTVGGELTPLAGAIREVIEAFGGAGEIALPEVLQAAVDLAPGVATLVSELGELARDIIPLLTNVSTGALGSLTGLTGIFHELVGALSLLPDGLQQAIGGFGTLALVIPGVGEALTLPISMMLKTQRGVEALEVAAKKGIDASAALSASFTKAGLVGAAVIGFQVVTNAINTGQQRVREYAESVNLAARAFKEFQSTGEAAAAFIADFESEGAKIGSFERIADGISSVEIRKNLGITEKQMTTLVEGLARFGGAANATKSEVEAAYAAIGLDFQSLGDAGLDTFLSLDALTEQFAKGAKEQFRAAVGSQKFAFVMDDTALSIDAAAQRSGDYIQALDDLDAANQRGAESAIAEAKARGATNEQIDAAIAANTKYTFGVDGAVTSTIDYVAAFQDLNEQLQQQGDLFDSLNESLPGFTNMFGNLVNAAGSANLGATFIDFAQAVDAAGLSADDLNAIANKLGGTLGTALSGDELGKVIAGFVTMIEGFKSELEAVIPGIADLQLEADSFSLDGFIAELNRVAQARVEVSANVQELIDRFGTIGSRALDALISSGLSKDQFAIALSQALEGSDEVVRGKLLALTDAFNAAIGPNVDALAEELAARRFSPEEIDRILGTDAFADGADRLGATVGGLDPIITDAEAKVARLHAAADALSARGRVGQARLLEADAAGLGASGNVPRVDTAAAVAGAQASGQQAGDAFARSFGTEATSGLEALGADIATRMDSLGVAGAAAATLSGKGLAGYFKAGFGEEADKLDVPLKRALTTTTNRVLATAKNQGGRLGEELADEFGNKLGVGILDVSEKMTSLLMDVGQDMTTAFDDGMELNEATVAEMEAMQSAVVNASRGLISSMRTLATGMTHEIVVGFNPGPQIAAQLLKMAPRLVSTARSIGIQIGASLNQGVALGLRATAFIAQLAAETVANSVASSFRRPLKISSPSQIFHGFGEDINAGLARGIYASTGQVVAAVTGTAMAASIAGRSASATFSPGTSAGGTIGVAASAASGAVSNRWENSFSIDARGNADPEMLAAQIAVRLERKMSR